MSTDRKYYLFELVENKLLYSHLAGMTKRDNNIPSLLQDAGIDMELRYTLLLFLNALLLDSSLIILSWETKSIMDLMYRRF